MDDSAIGRGTGELAQKLRALLSRGGAFGRAEHELGEIGSLGEQLLGDEVRAQGCDPAAAGVGVVEPVGDALAMQRRRLPYALDRFEGGAQVGTARRHDKAYHGDGLNRGDVAELGCDGFPAAALTAQDALQHLFTTAAGPACPCRVCRDACGIPEHREQRVHVHKQWVGEVVARQQRGCILGRGGAACWALKLGCERLASCLVASLFVRRQLAGLQGEGVSGEVFGEVIGVRLELFPPGAHMAGQQQ